MSSETIETSGTCLCGAIRVKAKNLSKKVGACHCHMCRKWGGGPLMATDCGNDVSIEGEENVSVFNSSDWAERGFCKQCGTHLFYRIKESRQYVLPVGLFDENERLKFEDQIFIDEKPSFYEFANKTNNMTGAEVFAKYMSPSGE